MKREHTASPPWVVCTALRAELTPILARLRRHGRLLGKVPDWPGVREARLHGHTLYVGAVGMGRASAHIFGQALLRREVRGLLLLGLGGGIDPALPAGHLGLARVVAATDGPDRHWHTREATLRHAEAALAQTALPGSRVKLLTVDDVIRAPHAKAALWRHFHCGVVDMESAPIVAAAHAAGIPWLCVRAVFDPADEWLPPLQRLATARGPRLVAELLRLAATHPLVAARLPRLGMRASRCGRRLAAFADTFLRLAGPEAEASTTATAAADGSQTAVYGVG